MRRHLVGWLVLVPVAAFAVGLNDATRPLVETGLPGAANERARMVVRDGTGEWTLMP